MSTMSGLLFTSRRYWRTSWWPFNAASYTGVTLYLLRMSLKQPASHNLC